MMDWTAIIVAVVAMFGTAIGSLYGIKKSNSLIEYRMDQLEEKVDKHNNLVERMYEVEEGLSLHCEKIKEINHRLEDLKDQKSATSKC